MKDRLSDRARREGLRARSAYKLKELNSKYRFLRKGKLVLDLGSWPGGWSVVAAQFGKVVAVDLKEMEPVAHCSFIRGDLFSEDILEELPLADVVLCDAAPSTTGHIEQDQYQSYLLAERALAIAVVKLKSSGSFVCKIFQGAEFEEFLKKVRKQFGFVKCAKPQSSRRTSKEMYVVGMEFIA